MEQTVILIKPDVASNSSKSLNLMLDLIQLASIYKCYITRAVSMKLTTQQVQQFYAEHASKSFFKEIEDYMTSASIIALIVEGPNAITVCRNILGATNPANAEAGTLRAKYGTSIGQNGTHGSDSTISAQREKLILFGQ